jgi:hypothetical protein
MTSQVGAQVATIPSSWRFVIMSKLPCDRARIQGRMGFVKVTIPAVAVIDPASLEAPCRGGRRPTARTLSIGFEYLASIGVQYPATLLVVATVFRRLTGRIWTYRGIALFLMRRRT